MRYTKKDVQGMFERLMKAAGKRQAPIMIDGQPAHGGWSLDYSSVYGGYVIEEDYEGGGIDHPFGAMRRSSREMYLSMLMTAQMLEDIAYKKTMESE